MAVVLDDAAERMLLIWRHRSVLAPVVWELPGGCVDPGEDGITAVAREVEAAADPAPSSPDVPAHGQSADTARGVLGPGR